jgi:hypothetical protein
MLKLLLAAFLLAHGLIHASFLSPTPPQTAAGPEWPFEMSRSWLVTGMGVDPTLVRLLGIVLIAISLAAFALAALSTVGVLVPSASWAALVIVGAAASLTQLAFFFHPWLVLGLLIDAVLLWAVTVQQWTPFTAWDV